MKHHPLTILYRISLLIKNSFIFVLILFVFQRESEFWLVEFGRYAFFIIFTLRIIHIIFSWFCETYEWEKNQFFKAKKGIFVKHTNTVPFSRIQNVTQRTPFFHRIFGMTSLTFKTAIDGEDDDITFDVLTREQAAMLSNLVHHEENAMDKHEELYSNEADKRAKQTPVSLFTPTKKDLWKASFTSLSFLAIVPVAVSLHENVEPLLSDVRSDHVLFQLLNQTWLVALLAFIAVIVAIAFGVVRTFTRYGNYEIAASKTHIFINRGILDESFFTIEKKKIQGIEIKQTFIKRLWGLAEVKLISSASPEWNGQGVQVSSLYPFLRKNQALQITKELLPDYTFSHRMTRLPKVTIWVKLMRPSWPWIITTAALFYFQPHFLGIEQAWWIFSLILLIIMLTNRVLDYAHTKYSISADQLQWWRGGLTTKLFITKRKNVFEAEYTQSILQKPFRLFSIKTKNRSTPIHIDGINDLPAHFTETFNQWYKKRKDDITIS